MATQAQNEANLAIRNVNLHMDYRSSCVRAVMWGLQPLLSRFLTR